MQFNKQVEFVTLWTQKRAVRALWNKYVENYKPWYTTTIWDELVDK